MCYCYQKILILSCNSLSLAAQPQATTEEEEVQPVPTVPEGKSPEDNRCAVCYEKFDFFFNDDLEEWHLRGAIRVHGKTFHPTCYEDYKVSTFIMT
jgi:pre-mRNA cleavage complex 2 protein Pcf11